MPKIVLDQSHRVPGTKSISLQKWLLLGAAAIALVAPSAAYANPLGGTVTTGLASVSASAGKTNVNQKSEDVVIDWSSFNIGSGQTTQFIQPNAQAIAVNRIGSASASQILGTLDANGRVVLINGNGLLIGKGAQVNVGSLIATSTDGSDSDLLSGNFTQAGKQTARIVNQGQIIVGTSGGVALVAPSVTNAGTVNAKLGTVALGAANKFTVDFAGDGLVSFASQGDVNSRASAINSGLLSGANVSMTAHAANGIATGVVYTSGTIEAEGVRNVGGSIYLDAGNGTLTTKGTLNAAGATGGGQIETSGTVANISGHITAGAGGLWKVDPDDLTIDSNAASSIDGALDGNTSVVEQTTSGAASGYGNQTPGQGDINVDSALTWNSGATLTLDSYHSINFNAPITITGAGGLVLVTDDINKSPTANYFFNNGASVSYTDVVGGNTQGSLEINGAPFELVNSLTQLESAVAGNTAANIALANSYDAAPDGTYSNSPVTTTFGGSFEGLGNTISNLTINAPTTSDVGLFSEVGGTGTFSNVSLSNVNITGQYNTGGFIGFNDYDANLRNISVTGSITSTTNQSGGLVGTDTGGTILDSHTDVAITGVSWIGGLVGNLGGAIVDSYATGSVAAADQGPGGLAGESFGSITGSYSTGSVSSGAYDAGGLVGDQEGGSILDSYSLAKVTNANREAGGLVGGVEQGANTITDSWAAGYVTAANGEAGGLVGNVDGGTLTVTNSYWDKLTTGQTISSNSPNSDGLTTSALQASLQTGLDDGAFAIVEGVTYPYLTWQVPSGTPQVLAGTVYAANGAALASGQSVSAMIAGTQITPLTAMGSGADGYYYLLLSPNTFPRATRNTRDLPPESDSAFAYLTGGTPGNTYVASVDNGDEALVIDEDRLIAISTAPSASALFADLNAAVGSATGADFLYTAAGGLAVDTNFYVADRAATFDIDTALDLGTGSLWLYDPRGSIEETGGAGITAHILRGVSQGGTTLDSTDNAVAVLGPFTNTGAGGFSLYDDRKLLVDNDVDAGTGDLSLTSGNGDIVIVDNLTAGGSVSLSAEVGSIWQNPGSSVITAGTLTGNSSGSTRLQGANAITDLGAFTTTNGTFSLTNSQTLTVDGIVNAGANVLTLQTTDGDIDVGDALEGRVVSLTSTLGEVSGSGNISANILDVSADTGIDLTGDNEIGRIKTDTTNSGLNVIDN